MKLLGGEAMANHVTVLRKKAGYKITDELAESLGISKRMLYAIESDQRQPSAKTATKMAKLYNCNLEDIFFAFLQHI
jgi:putative transcriptional regulator